MTSASRTARAAGLLYVLLGLTAIFSIIYVPRAIIVRGDPAATARNIAHAGTLFRMGIASELLSQTIFLFAALTFYRLLKDVDRDWARAMVALVAVGVAVEFANSFNLVAAQMLLGGGPTLAGFAPAQLEQLAYVFLRLRASGISIVTWFWGLWLMPLGMLVARSGFLPRILGVLLIMAGAGYAVFSAWALLAPGSAPTFFTYVTQPLGGIGEGSLVLWLLIKGTRDHGTNEQQWKEQKP